MHYKVLTSHFNVKKYSNIFALLFLHLVLGIVIACNFPHNKYFIGWDALNPEFNFSVNILRGIFGFWQENYGVGLLSGHGFAATLPHSLILFVLSLIIPTIALRAVFTFLCLYLGTLGMYVFLRFLLHKQSSIYLHDIHASVFDFIAMIGALFYMLNLGTVQIFYIQLEAFIACFAALPWLFWILTRTLEFPSHRNIRLFLLINLLASIHGFIPSLFAAYAIG